MSSVVYGEKGHTACNMLCTRVLLALLLLLGGLFSCATSVDPQASRDEHQWVRVELVVYRDNPGPESAGIVLLAPCKPADGGLESIYRRNGVEDRIMVSNGKQWFEGLPYNGRGILLWLPRGESFHVTAIQTCPRGETMLDRCEVFDVDAGTWIPVDKNRLARQ